MTFTPLPLSPYERFIWNRLAVTARIWRSDPHRVSAANFEKAARVASGLPLPFAEEDARSHQMWAILEWGPRWTGLPLDERNQAWPEIVPGLAAIDLAAAAEPVPSGAPSSPPVPVPVTPEVASPWYLQD